MGQLPCTRDWREVISLMHYGASAAQIGVASLHAARQDLASASKDKGLLFTTQLLAALPHAARADSFSQTVYPLGLTCPEEPDRHTLAAAFCEAVDQHLLNNSGRTDLGELAQMAAVESLQVRLAQQGELFDPQGKANCRDHLGEWASPVAFGGYIAGFAARLLFKLLDNYLSRAVNLHVGEGQRFACLADVATFYQALEMHCHETSGVLTRFVPDYLHKHQIAQGQLTSEKLRDFVHGAASKLGQELERRHNDGDE
jgi:hypothetical protein